MPKFSLRKRLLSFTFAFKGIAHFLKTQHNAWIHLIAAAFVIASAFWLKVSMAEWIWLAFAIGFVLVSELFNTAIEFLVDLVSPDFNPKAGLVKDIAAGAVLIAALTSVVIGMLVFLPKLLLFFF
jgi:diacylglycerol kinase